MTSDAQRARRRHALRGEDRDPRHRLGAQARAGHELRRPRDRHGGGVGARGAARDARRDRRRRVGRRDRLGLRAHGHPGACCSRRSTACSRPRTPTSPRSPAARSPSRTSRSTPARSCRTSGRRDSSVRFAYGDQHGEADWLVIAAGRGPDVEGLGLDEAGRRARRPRADRGRRPPAHVGARRLRDRRHRPRPGARPQVLRRGHHRRRGRRGHGDPRARVRRHPARHVLRARTSPPSG